MDFGLRAELLRRGRRDQHFRTVWLDGGGDWAAVRRVDASNTAWLAAVIAEHGWPGHMLVGTDGAHAAWLLAQHAPAKHQAAWLPLLRSAVERGDARARDLAYLEDRVAMHHGAAQRYGTQWRGSGAAARLFPLADPAGVNDRRAELGLTPIAQHHLDQALRLGE